jgi:predicted glycoside hydrolase/deacetylase ChbG (UPF0249 family)
MSRLLIVNADDYGRTPGVSAGIRTAHNQGLVSTSTVMINMSGAPAEVERALRESPGLGLGVHLNLTVGPPCAPAQDLSSLVDSQGQFKDRKALFQFPDRVDPAEVEIEWRAQIDAFLATGAQLDHLDSHHHIALLTPDLWETCLRMAKRFDCGVRTPVPADVPSQYLSDDFPQSTVDFIQQQAMARLRSAGRPCPDHFFASFFARGVSLEHLLSLLHKLPAGVSELMCHPGYNDDPLLSSSGYAKERPIELSILTHPDALQTITQLDIQLCTYRDVWIPSPEGS